MLENQQTQQATNEPKSESETSSVSNPEEQSVPQETKPQAASQETKPQESPRKTYNDRIAELESKIAKMEAIYQLQGQNVVDMEVCTDLILKGYTLDQLKQSKPYLFNQGSISNQGVIKQPPKVVSGVQTPKPAPSNSVSSDGFIKTLADMLINKF